MGVGPDFSHFFILYVSLWAVSVPCFVSSFAEDATLVCYCAFLCYVLIWCTAATSVFSFARSCTVSIFLTVKALGQIQLWSIFLSIMHVWVDAESLGDISVCCLGVCCEDYNGVMCSRFDSFPLKQEYACYVDGVCCFEVCFYLIPVIVVNVFAEDTMDYHSMLSFIFLQPIICLGSIYFVKLLDVVLLPALQS